MVPSWWAMKDQQQIRLFGVFPSIPNSPMTFLLSWLKRLHQLVVLVWLSSSVCYIPMIPLLSQTIRFRWVQLTSFNPTCWISQLTWWSNHHFSPEISISIPVIFDGEPFPKHGSLFQCYFYGVDFCLGVNQAENGLTRCKSPPWWLYKSFMKWLFK